MVEVHVYVYNTSIHKDSLFLTFFWEKMYQMQINMQLKEEKYLVGEYICLALKY